jgi:hypothetical protein
MKIGLNQKPEAKNFGLFLNYGENLNRAALHIIELCFLRVILIQ